MSKVSDTAAGRARVLADGEHIPLLGLGVCNVGVRELEEVMAAATGAPVVDQVQFSPFEYRRALLDAGKARGIAVEAYSPLGTGRYLQNETVLRVASRARRTPAQVLLRW